MKGVADVMNILEKIQMVFFHIKNNTDFGEKA